MSLKRPLRTIQPENDSSVRKKTMRGRNKSGSAMAAVLKDCGLILSEDGDSAHRLTVDQTVFLKRFHTRFASDLRAEENISAFVSDVSLFLDDEANLMRSLAPTQTAPECTTARAQTQDSLVRLLLLCEEVQTRLISYLLEKVALEAMSEAERSPIQLGSQSISAPQFVLMQIRWLNRLVDPEAVADKLLEIITVSSDQLQREIIVSLPEIVDDARQHSKLAMSLRDLMNEKRELTNAILEAFTNLSIKSDTLSELQNSILKTIPGVLYEDLPIVVKFILQSIIPGEERRIIAELREQLDLQEIPDGLSRQQLTQRSKRDNKDADVLTMQAIQSSLASNKSVCNAWINIVGSLKVAAEHKPLDILALFLLHAIPSKRKTVQSIVRNKIRTGYLSEELVIKSFRNHKVVLSQSFEDVLAIAESLCQSLEPALNYFSIVFYREAFHNFDKFQRQEIVADLVTKISCMGPGTSRQTAIRALSSLVRECTAQMVPFGLFVTSILDQLDTMELSHVRQVMDLLSFLAYNAQSGLSSLRDNLHIVIRKQLLSSNSKLRLMGVTSALAVVKNMSQCTASSTTNKQARQILDMILAKGKSSADATGALFMDEMARLVENKALESGLESWISDMMTDDFLKDFVVDLKPSDSSQPDAFLPMAARYDLELEPAPEEETSIALNICPLVISSFGFSKENARNTSVSRLIQHFRLLKTCTGSQNDGDLVEVDALLGCPVWMPKRVVFDKFETLSAKERNVTCASLFYCVNWFRELINAFATQSGSENRRKVVGRLKMLVLLHDDLALCLKYNPLFVPPTALPLSDTSKWQPAAASAAGKGKKAKAASKGEKTMTKGKGKGKGSRRKLIGESAINLDSQASSPLESTAKPPPEDESVTAVDLDNYAPFFRELDLEAFSVLSYSTVAIGSEVSDEDSIDWKEPSLGPKELAYLLKDLLLKLEHSLVSSKSKKIFPGKTSLKNNVGFDNIDLKGALDVARFGVQNLDYLLGNLDEIASYFKRLVVMNDGDMDCASLFTSVTPFISQCFELILNILKALLGWNGFLSQDQTGQLKEALLIIGRRIQPNLKLQQSTKELAGAALQHVKRFSESVLVASVAGAHLKLLEVLLQHSDPNQGKSKAMLAEVAEDYLKRTWKSATGAGEKGAKFNGHVEVMLRGYFSHTDNFNAAFEAYMDELELLRDGAKASSKQYATFTKQTFPVHFRVLLEFLQENSTRIDDELSNEDQLRQWALIVDNLEKLVKVLKTQSARPLVALVLKHSRVLLDVFLKRCMPLLDQLFKRVRSDCIDLLKSVQGSTRYLQYVCSHSKVNRDVALAKHVPALKRTLEQFLYRVKAMLALNDAASAFWMGNLKNRDLAGEEILSQTVSSKDSDSDEEELPEDDQSDVDLDANDEAAEESEVSEEEEED